MHDRKIGWFYLVGALVIGVARVLANVHYPIDILGGALIGTLVAVVVERAHLFQFFQKRRGR
jgi:undecaprenyl-diphosphatase